MSVTCNDLGLFSTRPSSNPVSAVTPIRRLEWRGTEIILDHHRFMAIVSGRPDDEAVRIMLLKEDGIPIFDAGFAGLNLRSEEIQGNKFQLSADAIQDRKPVVLSAPGTYSLVLYIDGFNSFEVKIRVE